jgi:hypothetical protein
MNILSRLSVAISLAVVCATSVFAAALTSAEQSAGKNKIASDFKFDNVACTALRANARDICYKQAKGKENDARAELIYAISGTEKDANKMRIVKADSAFAIAKEMCDDRTGNDKDVCRAEAKRTHVDALADNKMIKTVGAAEKKDMDVKRDQDYKVAIEKCDALSGDPKDVCVSAAKLQLNKS